MTRHLLCSLGLGVSVEDQCPLQNEIISAALQQLHSHKALPVPLSASTAYNCLCPIGSAHSPLRCIEIMYTCATLLTGLAE